MNCVEYAVTITLCHDLDQMKTVDIMEPAWSSKSKFFSSLDSGILYIYVKM